MATEDRSWGLYDQPMGHYRSVMKKVSVRVQKAISADHNIPDQKYMSQFEDV